MLAACVQKRIHPATSAYKSVSPTNAGHSCRFDILARVAHRDAGLVLWASEANRPAILAGFAAAFLALGAGGIWYVAGASKRRNSLFKETIAVLKGDEQALSQALRGTGD